MAQKVGSTNETEVCVSALEAGKHFLLELLDAAVFISSFIVVSVHLVGLIM